MRWYLRSAGVYLGRAGVYLAGIFNGLTSVRISYMGRQLGLDGGWVRRLCLGAKVTALGIN